MSKILALAMRPQRLSQLIGQKAIREAIRKQIASRPPQAWMFTGSPGCGKTSISRIIAMAFQCTHQTEWGEPCDACWARRSDFTIHEINASQTSGVEEIEKLADLARYRPMPPSLKRVFILDEAQLLTNNAQNLLLKPFEEPVASTIWIINTTAPAKILSALRRRCMTYRLGSLSYTSIDILLKRATAKIKLDRPIEGLTEQINQMGITSPALVLMALENYASGMSAADAIQGADASGVDSFRVCKAVTNGGWKALKPLLMNLTPEDARWIRASVAGWLKGIMLKNSGAQVPAAAEGLRELLDMAPMDDALLTPWLVAALYRICIRFEKVN